jgi:hypothetical protein
LRKKVKKIKTTFQELLLLAKDGTVDLLLLPLLHALAGYPPLLYRISRKTMFLPFWRL